MAAAPAGGRGPARAPSASAPRPRRIVRRSPRPPGRVSSVDAAARLERRAPADVRDRRAQLARASCCRAAAASHRRPAPRRSSSRERHSTSSGTSGIARRAPARTAAPTPPAMKAWFSLIRIWSQSPMRWLTPPPARTAAFSSSRRPGVVLRVSRIRAPVPSTARAKSAVCVATPLRRCSRFSAVRSAASSARASPSTRSTGPPLAPDALVGQALERARRRRAAEDVLGGLEPEDDARLLLGDRRAGARRPAGTVACARQVARADVLGERARDDVLELAAGRVVHRGGG